MANTCARKLHTTCMHIIDIGTPVQTPTRSPQHKQCMCFVACISHEKAWNLVESADANSLRLALGGRDNGDMHGFAISRHRLCKLHFKTSPTLSILGASAHLHLHVGLQESPTTLKATTRGRSRSTSQNAACLPPPRCDIMSHHGGKPFDVTHTHT